MAIDKPENVATPFDAATDYAVRQCGDLPRLAAIDPSKVEFVRKDFIAHYKRYRETCGMLAPSREEAQQMLNALLQRRLLEPEGVE